MKIINNLMIIFKNIKINNLKFNYKDGDSLKKIKMKKRRRQKFKIFTENVKLLSFKEEENLDLIPKKRRSKN